MGAMIFHEFDKGFCLTEEGLRRIQSIIKDRLPSDCTVSYRVIRSDVFSYKTTELDDVLSEANDATRQVIALEITAKPTDDDDESAEGNEKSFLLMLAFRSSRTSGYYWDGAGCSLEIQGKDRDAAYLMLSELKNYITSDVANLRRIDRSSFEIVFLGVALVLSLIGLGMLTISPQLGVDELSTAAQAALKSTDISEKLNYLISVEQKRKSFSGFAMLFILIAIAAFGLPTLATKMINRFFPTDIFVWGKRKLKHESDAELKGKLFWGVAVATVISVAAGVVVWKMTT